MVITEIVRTNKFEKSIRSIRDGRLKEHAKKQIEKILSDPFIGKPLQYGMKGERTIYVKPFRIIYSVEGNTLTFLNFSHRDEVYRR